MEKFLKILTVFFVASAIIFAVSCKHRPDNPNEPDVVINFTIYPNTLEYQELNIVGGWLYVTSQLPSYGIIIYRHNMNEFKAYERKAPNRPNACSNNRLIVDFPFVLDTCINYKYSILDGSILEGTGYNLIEYFTEFDGTALRVYN